MLVLRRSASLLVAIGAVFFGAFSAHGYSTSMVSNYTTGALEVGDTVQVTVTFDTDGSNDVSLLSVSVLFDPTVFSYNQGASSSLTYALYTGGKGATYLAPATTNLSLRVGTNDQVLLDWQNNVLPGGAAASGSFEMGVVTFVVNRTVGDFTDFTLSATSPGNTLFLGDDTFATNNLSGDFQVETAAAVSCGPGQVVRDLNCDGKSDMLFSTLAEGGFVYSVIMDGDQKVPVTLGEAISTSLSLSTGETVLASLHADTGLYADIATRLTGVAEAPAAVYRLLSNGFAVDPQDGVAFYQTGGVDWEFIGRGDINGDDVDDLLFQANGNVTDPESSESVEGLVRALLLADDGSYTIVHPGFLPGSNDEPAAPCTVVGIADINADGRDDIACQRADGLVDALLMSQTSSIQYGSFLVNLAAVLVADLPFPEFAFPTAYSFADLAEYSANGAADVVLVKNDNSLLGPRDKGLIGLLINSGVDTSGVFIPTPAEAPFTSPSYTVLQNPDYTLGQSGNYDGVNASDFSSRYEGVDAANPVQVFLQGADGTTRLSNGIPLSMDKTYVMVD